MARLRVGTYGDTLTAEVAQLARHDNIEVTLANGNVVTLTVNDETGTVNITTNSPYAKTPLIRPVVGNSFDVVFASLER